MVCLGNKQRSFCHVSDCIQVLHFRMGKTRDLFKKIRDIKGTFHAKMDSIKDRNGMDLIEAEDIKKRWQEYTEKLYKKDLHDPDNHDGVITHLKPDILECEISAYVNFSQSVSIKRRPEHKPSEVLVRSSGGCCPDLLSSQSLSLTCSVAALRLVS